MFCCEKCCKEFKTNWQLQRHLSKKTPCKVIPQETSFLPQETSKIPQETSFLPQETSFLPQETSLKCDYCCQEFSRLDSLKRHETGCKERQCVVRHLEVQLGIPIEIDIHSKQCRFCKKEFSQKCNCTRHKNTCKMKMKYLTYLEDKLKEHNKENMKGVTSITNNTNTNCNNVTNNIINVKGIGEEDLSYLTVKVIKALSNEFKSDQEFIAKTLAHIHANGDHPENHNIIYSNYSSNKALVKYDNEFKYTNINIVLRQAVENMLDNVALSVDFDKLPMSVKQRLEVVAEDDELDQTAKSLFKLALYTEYQNGKIKKPELVM